MASRSRSYDTSGAQAPRPEPQFSSGAAASRAEGEAAGSLFSYRIRQKVSVPSGSSALLPIVSAEVEGEQLSVLPLGSNTLHPLKSILLTNTTGLHLAAGPITLFEGGIYAGDARIGELSPGAERLLSYAVDLEARVVKERQSLPAEIVELSIRNGSLIYTRKERRTTRYRLIHSGKEPKRFLIEHPAPSQGWQLASPEADERSPSAYRFLRTLGPAVDGGSTSVQLEVTEEYPREQRYALSGADPERLRYFLSGGTPGPELRAALERVADMQSEIRSLKRELETVERRIGDLHREQQRIRSNMEALSENSSLYKRYVRELSSQEDSLVALEERRSSLREELRRLQERLDAYLNDLEI